MESEMTLTGKRLFIVEDDPLLQHLLTDKMAQLRAKGLEVHSLSSGEEALTKAKEAHPDLIMLDVLLPGMSGFDFLEELRKDPAFATTPTVILSNLSADADKDRAKSLGVIGYLVKANFSLKEISGAIEKILLQNGTTIVEATEDPSVEKTSQGNIIFI
jgi:DNA-binding response OmpR family regulator